MVVDRIDFSWYHQGNKVAVSIFGPREYREEIESEEIQTSFFGDILIVHEGQAYALSGTFIPLIPDVIIN